MVDYPINYHTKYEYPLVPIVEDVVYSKVVTLIIQYNPSDAEILAIDIKHTGKKLLSFVKLQNQEYNLRSYLDIDSVQNLFKYDTVFPANKWMTARISTSIAVVDLITGGKTYYGDNAQTGKYEDEDRVNIDLDLLLDFFELTQEILTWDIDATKQIYISVKIGAKFVNPKFKFQRNLNLM